MINFDKDTASHGFLTVCEKGKLDMYDVYGDTHTELKASALEIVDFLGLDAAEIIWNFELPE